MKKRETKWESIVVGVLYSGNNASEKKKEREAQFLKNEKRGKSFFLV